MIRADELFFKLQTYYLRSRPGNQAGLAKYPENGMLHSSYRIAPKLARQAPIKVPEKMPKPICNRPLIESAA